MFAVAHFGKTLQRLGGGAFAPGAGRSRLSERATADAHLLCCLFIHVRVARLDQILSRLIHEIEIVAGEENVFAPVKAQPLHGMDN